MPHKILAQHLDQISLKFLRTAANELFIYGIRRGRNIRPAETRGVC
jgi:hypothetical protein